MARVLTGPGAAWLGPLRCSGTPLPPNVLLAAKLIVGCMMVKGYVLRIPEPFLPLLPFFPDVSRPDLFQTVLQVAFGIAAIGLFLNRRVRLCSLVVGLIFLIGPLSARATYTNGKFFCASMLILIGLYAGRHSIWLLRSQLVIMYLGSGLNKLLEADWRSGQYMEYWLISLQDSATYAALASLFPPLAFSKFVCWSTIGVELWLAVGLAVPRLYRPAIWTAAGYHTASIFFAGHDFGIFYSALLASFLVFAEWPGRGEVRISFDDRKPVARRWQRAASLLDVDGLFRWTPASSEGGEAELRLTWAGRVETGVSAFNLWLLLTPATYAMVAMLIAGLPWNLHEMRVTVAFAGILWFFPATEHVLRRTLRCGQRRE